jgi:hypothetical protein
MSTYKLHPTAWNGTIKQPQYQLAYATIGSPAASQARSREILGRFISGRDIIIEMNSSLLSAPEKDRDAIAQAFRKAVEVEGLAVTERHYPSEAKVSFFAKILGMGGDSEACDMRALVPNAVWRAGRLAQALTPSGLRYYVLPEGTDGASLVERLNLGTISSQDVLAAMEIVIFDVPHFGQMGVISTRLDQAALQERLSAGN